MPKVRRTSSHPAVAKATPASAIAHRHARGRAARSRPASRQ
jgi:hypothetical protein